MLESKDTKLFFGKKEQKKVTVICKHLKEKIDKSKNYEKTYYEITSKINKVFRNNFGLHHIFTYSDLKKHIDNKIENEKLARDLEALCNILASVEFDVGNVKKTDLFHIVNAFEKISGTEIKEKIKQNRKTTDELSELESELNELKFVKSFKKLNFEKKKKEKDINAKQDNKNKKEVKIQSQNKKHKPSTTKMKKPPKSPAKLKKTIDDMFVTESKKEMNRNLEELTRKRKKFEDEAKTLNQKREELEKQKHDEHIPEFELNEIDRKITSIKRKEKSIILKEKRIDEKLTKINKDIQNIARSKKSLEALSVKVGKRKQQIKIGKAHITQKTKKLKANEKEIKKIDC